MPSVARKHEAATRVRLSAQQEAIISPPGRVVLLNGTRAHYLNEREMAALVRAWTDAKDTPPSETL